MACRPWQRSLPALVGAAIAAPGLTRALDAQVSTQTSAPLRCQGQVVSAIDIRAENPSPQGLGRFVEAAADAVGLHHSTTRASVIESFLDLAVGEPCTEFRRAESERVLRAQPFIATATVRPVADTAGTVRIEVVTTDEIPFVFNGALRGGVPSSLTLGNGNVGGRGILVVANGERGGAYRDGIGLHVVNYAFFDRPYTLDIAADRAPLGGHLAFSVVHPFFTNLQRSTWHVGIRDDHDYYALVRPAGDALVLPIKQQTWDVTGILRQRIFGQVAFIGGVVARKEVVPAAEAVVASDSGLVADTGITLRNRFAPFRATRAGVIGGMRVVKFATAVGFDALTATQDIATGVQFGALVSHGFASLGSDDLFTSAIVYGGLGTARSFAALQLQGETRRDNPSGRWDSMVASGRLVWYHKPSAHETLIVSNEFSGGLRTRLPLQLTFADRDGGLRGFTRSTLAGATRDVVRVERRHVLARPFRRADIGFAGFVDAGMLWAGSAPYGQTGARASLGASLLGAYPMGSKRLYRIDLAVPVTHDARARWELRVSSGDFTRRFWREPGDVAQARTGAVPSSFFTRAAQ